MTSEGCTDGAVFLAFGQKVLVPQLRPGHVVVLDNPKAHKVAGIAEAITTTGARLLYLPLFSPALSPIEECWSKVKTFLRTKAARTRETLEEAIAEAFEAVTVADAQGWFTHAGYCVIAADRQRSWMQILLGDNRQRIVQFFGVSSVSSFVTCSSAV